MANEAKLTWRAAIKRATMTQKFNDRGEVHSTLQLQCEGDMVDAEGTQALALLQKEQIVVITIEAAQLTLGWTTPAEQKGNTHAEISDQDSGSRRDPIHETADDLGVL